MSVETLPRRLAIGADGRIAGGAFLADAALLRLFDALDGEGEAARVVGGAVRNTLLGRPVADIDVTTTAVPQEVIRRARRVGLRTIPTGIDHGTVTVLAGGAAFEVTTLREDVETDGRHAVVRFSRDFAVDAARRDFTMNALSLSRDGTLHDTTGGVADLAAGRVRFIGDADTRIAEDVLRILRFFRFHAGYGVGPLDSEGLAAAKRQAPAMARLSRERVRAEWLKLLAAPGAVPVVEVVVATGIAARVMPGPFHIEGLAGLSLLEARRDMTPDPVLRLAALCGGTVAAIGTLREALRLSNEERDRLFAAIAARDDLGGGPPNTQGLRALLFNAGPRAALDGLMLAGSADAAPERWLAPLALLGTIDVPLLPLGGKDILARGVGNGRRVGAILKRLQADWIRAGFPQEPAELARLLAGAIALEDDGVGRASESAPE